MRSRTLSGLHLLCPIVPLALFTLYIIGSSTYLAIRFALESYPPFLFAGLRFLIAGTLLFGFLRLRSIAHPSQANGETRPLPVLLLGFGNGLVCFAEQRVSSGIAAQSPACRCLPRCFPASYGERPTRREGLGLTIGFIGVIVLNLGNGLSASRLGACALLIAAMCWALGSV